MCEEAAVVNCPTCGVFYLSCRCDGKSFEVKPKPPEFKVLGIGVSMTDKGVKLTPGLGSKLVITIEEGYLLVDQIPLITSI